MQRFLGFRNTENTQKKEEAERKKEKKKEEGKNPGIIMHVHDISQKFWICDTRVNPPCDTCLTKSLSYLFESMHGTEIVPVLFSKETWMRNRKAGVTSFLFQPRSRTHLCDTTKITRHEIFYFDYFSRVRFFFKWKFTSDSWLRSLFRKMIYYIWKFRIMIEFKIAFLI